MMSTSVSSCVSISVKAKQTDVVVKVEVSKSIAIDSATMTNRSGDKALNCLMPDVIRNSTPMDPVAIKLLDDIYKFITNTVSS